MFTIDDPQWNDKFLNNTTDIELLFDFTLYHKLDYTI